MKINRVFKLRCKACGRERTYGETETDLGFLDTALIMWCACDPRSVVDLPPKVHTDPTEGGPV